MAASPEALAPVIVQGKAEPPGPVAPRVTMAAEVAGMLPRMAHSARAVMEPPVVAVSAAAAAVAAAGTAAAVAAPAMVAVQVPAADPPMSAVSRMEVANQVFKMATAP